MNGKRWKKRANQRAAKERKRLERLTSDEPLPDLLTCPPLTSSGKRSGFRVIVVCMDDGEQVSFTTTRSPWGKGDLSISPTLAGKRVAMVLKEYKPV